MRQTKLSENLITKLAEYSAGSFTPAEFDRLISLFEENIRNVYFTQSSEANLLRILENTFNRVSLLRDCLQYPHYTEILISIAANSNYLTDILAVNPEFFHWVVNPSVLTAGIDESSLKSEIHRTLSQLHTFASKVNALKSIKRKEILRTGLRDIYEKVPLTEITKELSVLAKNLTSELFSVCYKEVLKKYGIEKISAKYSIVSLGKLGGGELNYSSDIDLILFYDKNRFIKKKKYLNEILTETVHLFLDAAAKGTGGILYRYDFRLRPDGRNSPICRSLPEYLNYYESRGEDWERQMLIKAAYLAGSKSLFDKFVSYLTPFVYPSAFKSSPQKQILKMKANIERQLKSEENIKLSFGGIRDIEFSVQALQLISGGNNQKLRTANTLDAIKRLERENLLSKTEAETLAENYILFRRIEHYLQLMNDRQTHVIPSSGEIAEKISFFLGYKNLSAFKRDIRKRRNDIRKIYNSILSEETTQPDPGSRFNEIKFEDASRAEKDFRFLREGKSIFGERTFDIKSIESFNKIEQALIEYLIKAVNPDKLLSNFVRVIKYAGFPSIWYNELQDDKFRKYFLNICEFSQYPVDMFAEDKELREFLLSRKVLMKIPAKELSDYSIKKMLFYFSVQIINGFISPVEASGKISSVIKKKIETIALEFSGTFEWKDNFFIAAFGSLGSSEITFASDIDLVFIVKNINRYKNAEKDFQQLLKLLRDELRPFKIDCRLRPEGKSSQLVWDFDEYKKYFAQRARVWEYQALTKICFTAGSKKLFDSFLAKLQFPEESLIVKEFVSMRKNLKSKITAGFEMFDLKKSSGGLTDIDFIVQYLILCNPSVFKKCIAKNNLQKIDVIRVHLSTDLNLDTLSKAFEMLKSIEIYNQLINSATSSLISLSEEKLKSLSVVMSYKSPGALKKEFAKLTNSVRKLYAKIFG